MGFFDFSRKKKTTVKTEKPSSAEPSGGINNTVKAEKPLPADPSDGKKILRAIMNGFLPKMKVGLKNVQSAEQQSPRNSETMRGEYSSTWHACLTMI